MTWSSFRGLISIPVKGSWCQCPFLSYREICGVWGPTLVGALEGFSIGLLEAAPRVPSIISFKVPIVLASVECCCCLPHISAQVWIRILCEGSLIVSLCSSCWMNGWINSWQTKALIWCCSSASSWNRHGVCYQEWKIESLNMKIIYNYNDSNYGNMTEHEKI